MHLYLTESGLTLDDLVERVNDELRRSGRCLAVVSEGFDVGDLGPRRDAFGHVEYAASRRTVMQTVINRLHDVGLPARGWAHGQIAGCDQRSMAVYASTVDRAEAFAVGRHAVALARSRGTGWMATILRAPGPVYRACYGEVPLRDVANFHRTLPAAWIAPSQIDVTDAFLRYAEPLIGEEWAPVPLERGLQRFARLERRFAAKRLPAYVPVAHRG